MLFDSDNSEEEPDFTGVDLTKNFAPPAAEEVDEAEECPRLPRKYSPEDLISVETDPSCKANWFLAAYWPVYVGNFKVEEWDEDTWYEQVSNYFAYNGLLTRMIYIHYSQQDDKDYASYQNKCMLIDMLVYFASKADAERAIATCHRDSYYGYKLNVLPGREPVFFNNERSVRFVALSDTSKFTPVETVMDNAMNAHGSVKYAGRYSNQNGTVVLEFASTEALVAGLSSQFRWKPSPMNREFMKQRFVEADVKLDIEWVNESNPSFMDMKPKPSVLIKLFEGLRPNVSTAWKGHDIYVKAPILAKRRKDTKQRMRMLFKRNKGKTLTKSQIDKALAELPEEAPEDDAPAVPVKNEKKPETKTKKQQEQENMKTINWFLRRYGAAPITRASVREAQLKVQKKMQEKQRAEKLRQCALFVKKYANKTTA